MKKQHSFYLLLGSVLLILASSPLVGSDVQGTWQLTAVADSGDEYDLILTLSEADGKVTGTLGNDEGFLDLAEVEFDGTNLSFSILTPEAIEYEVKLKLEGDTLKGTFRGDNSSSGKVTAQRSH
ncbi:MAG: hypothetical protein JSU96_12905 [Acidobacteriota bacterium]|nr:MAG: hypothetical protein JSU96_12905 [Acidobacteriota bacterium]